MAGFVVALTLLGLVVNEWVGPAVIVAALALWPLLLAPRAGAAARGVARMGMLVWLVPLLSLASTAWSPVPDATLRAAAELILTTALALLSTRLLPPDAMLTAIWLVFAAVVGLSTVVNHPVFDGDTGRVTAAGVFLNKNTLASGSGCLTLASVAIAASPARRGLVRVAAALAAVLGVAMAVRARSVADLVALAASVAALLGLLAACHLPPRYRRGAVAAVLAAGSAAGAALASLALSFSDTLLLWVDKDPTLTGRTLLWFYASRFHESRPWLGRGFGGFWYQGQPEAEYLWALEHIGSRSGFHFHSLMWQLLIDLGDAGLLCGAAMIGYTALGSVRWLRQAASPASAFYFAILLFSCIIQLQGLDLFQVFSPIYFLFLVAFGYSVTWRRWRPTRAAAATPAEPRRIHPGFIPDSRQPPPPPAIPRPT